MSDPCRAIIRRHARALVPVPTEVDVVLVRLPAIRAVLFDVYGTLFISANGGAGAEHADAFRGAIKATVLTADIDAGMGVRCLRTTIERRHGVLRSRGIEYPEVEMRDIWRDTVAELVAAGHLPPSALDVDPSRLAVEYEARANPTWPMPGLRETLGALVRGGVVVGLVSNAQFFTPELFPALLGDCAEALGVDPTFQYFSYRHGQAKPGVHLYEQARRDLARRGIRPGEVLHVGNDMLNDVVPASRVGFRTALFAGDARSLRLRTGDRRIESVRPDLVVPGLPSLLECVG